MRLSTEPTRDEPLAIETVEAALAAGVRVFDTARAYALGEADLGHNERLLGRALARRPELAPRVITKCGMRRDGGAWVPDGRARALRDDAHASVEALGGVPIDLLLLHAPDPRVSLATSARALARIQEAGLARSVGVSNVSRKQLEVAAGEAPIAAVQVALGAYDDLPIRNGVLGFCVERGIEVLAHAPLGGPERASKLARDPELLRIAASLNAAPIEVFLAYLTAALPGVVPIVGARRVETARSLARAATLALDAQQLAALDGRFASLGRARTPAALATRVETDVVLLMGVPGSGKSRAAEAYAARGYERLNRDQQGGTLKKLARMLEQRLAAGATRVVLDNTYVTRAARYDVLRAAATHAAKVRCVHLETSLADAQINVIVRMIERFGRVLEPEEIDKQARNDPAALAPHALFRTQRELEPPAEDEGFASIERVPFVRAPRPGGVAGTFVALAAVGSQLPEGSPVLVYAWQPGAAAESLSALRASLEAKGRVELAVCTHPGGRPICWCRPPLPALLLTFAQRYGIDLRASTLYGVSATDAAMARALGMRFVQV
jgi:aryl-alcohol dehydrogenase-like predicted oxidoreductase